MENVIGLMKEEGWDRLILNTGEHEKIGFEETELTEKWKKNWEIASSVKDHWFFEAIQ